MKPYTKTVINLFDGKKRFLIPLYQRHYAWRPSPQLELLWEDIERAVRRIRDDRASASPHFMGPIVVSQIKTYGNQVQAYEVIDGQQRLTTFQLLLAAFRDVAARHSSPYEAEAQRYLLNDGVMEEGAVERYKLWPSMTDRRSFVAIVDPAADLDAIAAPPTDEDGAVRRATAAYEFLRARIASHVEGGEDDAIGLLFEALRDALAVVSIELEGGDDPQTIFETLNSRGVDLTAGDLMRNFIFQRAKGMGQDGGSLTIDALYEKTWLSLDKYFWKESEGRGRQNAQRLDWLLTDHLSMHRAEQISITHLFETYRRWILNDRPFDNVTAELDAIVASAGVERRLMEKGDDALGRFGQFADAFDVSTAMPLVLFLAADAGLGDDPGGDLSAALRHIESFILRRDICGLPTGSYNRLFVSIIARLRQDDVTVDALERALATGGADTSSWPDDETFRLGWMGRDQYKPARQPRLRYLLGAIERERASAYGEDVTVRSDLTVEHIMPRKWREHWPVPGFGHVDPSDFDIEQMSREMEREAAVNKMGNLTLLTHKLNAAASNAAFEEKMPKVKANTGLALNRDLQEFDEWNEDTIAQRGTSLFEVARTIWHPPVQRAGLMREAGD